VNIEAIRAIKRARHWLLIAEGALKPEPKGRLVPNWRDVLRRSHSVKLAVLAPFALEAIWYVASSAPPELRAFITLPAYVVLAVLAIAARLWRQED
jgi:hypothetical protein